MRAKLFKSVASILLASALAFTPSGVICAAQSGSESTAASTQEDAVIKNKEEVIYAVLAPEGTVNAVYAVNHFEVTRAGNITDYGKYTSVKNLTGTDPLTMNGDSVSFHSGEGNFYYQGDAATRDIPWVFGIAYYLNGARTAPQDIAGQSGTMEIRLSTSQNGRVNPVFYENYMLQVSITLDNEKCADIQAPDATIASAGNNTVVTYTVMPKKDADIRLSALVKDFTMSGIQITGMPLSFHMDLPDTQSMVSDFEKLSDAISDLNDGVGGLVGGVADLKSGTSGLISGSDGIKSGLSDLSGNAQQLLAASTQMKNALAQMSSAFNSASSGQVSLDDFMQLPQALSQLAQGLKDVSDGMNELKTNFSSAYAALNAAIEEIPDTSIPQDQIDALYADTDESRHGTLDSLVAYYTAGKGVRQAYSQVKDAFDAVGATLNTLSGSIDTIADNLNDMSTQIDQALSGGIMQQLGQLSSGLSELSQSYAGFDAGLSNYMNGVESMAAGYAQFHDGLTAFAGGINSLYDGAVQLHDGTTKLNSETRNMPDTLKAEIDDLMNEYTGADFKPVSFFSSQNANVSLVQFVLKCDGIEKPDDKKEEPAVVENETLWDRFIGLFK